MNIIETTNNNQITVGNEDNSIVSGDHSTIRAGDGDNFVSLSGTGANTIYLGTGNNTVISGGTNVVTTGGGDDFVSVDGGLLLLGDGDNHVSLGNTSALIEVGWGNDVIFSQANYNVISDRGGKNSIVSSGGHSTIYTGGGSDTIILGGNASSVVAGNGDNLISVTGEGGNSIFTGKGNDTIDLTGTTGTNMISPGIGNDVIINALNGTTLRVAELVTGVVNGENAILSNSYGQITLFGGAGKTLTIIVDNTLDTTPASLHSSNLIYDTARTSLTLSASFNGVLSSTSYDSSVRLIDASAVSSSVGIHGNANDNTIEGGDGDDFLRGGAGDDYLVGRGGSDVLRGDGGNDVFVVDGNDLILDYEDGDTIKIEDGAVDFSLASGDDVILVIGSSSVTALGGVNQELAIDGLQSNAEYIIGTARADVLRAGDEGSTLEGAGGKDKLYGGAGRDIFLWTVGDGNDLIYNYDADDGDMLKINGIDSIDASYFKESGKKIILKIGKEKLTVNDVKDKPVTINYGTGIFTFNAPLEEGLELGKNKKTLTVSDPFSGEINLAADFSTKVKTVDATAVTSAISIIGNAKTNTLKAGSGGSTMNGGLGSNKLYGGDGADVFVYGGGKDQVFDCESGDRIVLNTAVDKVTVSGKNVKFKLGKGSMTIKNVVDREVTITDSSGVTAEYIFNRTRNTLDSARLVSNSQLSAYWFEEQDSTSDPLGEILSPDAAIDLDFDQLSELLKPATIELVGSARKQSKK